MAVNNTVALRDLIDKYGDLIQDNDYRAIMNDPHINPRALGVLLEMFNKAQVKPFTTIDKVGDTLWFAHQLWDMKKHWISGESIRSWDTTGTWDWETVEGIAKAAYALGANVWFTENGFFGNKDYLISMMSGNALFCTEDWEDVDPNDFKEVHWTDKELFE